MSEQADQAVQDLTGRLYQRMWRNRVSQQEVAEHLGLPQSAVSKRLRNQSKLSVVEFLDIAWKLGVAPAALLADVLGEGVVVPSAGAAHRYIERNGGSKNGPFLQGPIEAHSPDAVTHRYPARPAMVVVDTLASAA